MTSLDEYYECLRLIYLIFVTPKPEDRYCFKTALYKIISER